MKELTPAGEEVEEEEEEEEAAEAERKDEGNDDKDGENITDMDVDCEESGASMSQDGAPTGRQPLKSQEPRGKSHKG